MKRFGYVALGMLLGVVVSVAAARLIRSQRAAPVSPVVLEVNGEKISLEQLLERLKGVGTAPVLTSLLEEKLIDQEAAKHKISIPEKQERALEDLANQIKETGARATYLHQLQTQMKLRSLLLQGVSEEEKKATYQQFKQQFRQYELSAIHLRSYLDARDAEKRLRNGESFSDVADRYGLGAGNAQGKVGFLTESQIELWLGEEALEQVRRLKQGQCGDAIYTKAGLMILRRGAVKERYEEARPLVEAVIANSRQMNYMYELYSSANIKSPFLQDPAPEVKTEAPTPAVDTAPI